MKIDETVRPATDRQKRVIEATMRQAIPEDLSFEEAERVIGGKGPFLRNVHDLFLRYRIGGELLWPWQEFWDLSLAGLVIPPRREGFDRLLVIGKGATIENEFQKCAKLFPCWKSTEYTLDIVVPTNDRNPQKGTYALWVRDRVEADEELRNYSATALRKICAVTLTLLERIVYERMYFHETDEHLDIQNVTLCAGSRGRDGNAVPGAHFNDEKFSVRADWFRSGIASRTLRAREAVVAAS